MATLRPGITSNGDHLFNVICPVAVLLSGGSEAISSCILEGEGSEKIRVLHLAIQSAVVGNEPML